MAHQSDAFSDSDWEVDSRKGADGAEMFFDSVQLDDIHW
jgi:hypothetical protein